MLSVILVSIFLALAGLSGKASGASGRARGALLGMQRQTLCRGGAAIRGENDSGSRKTPFSFLSRGGELKRGKGTDTLLRKCVEERRSLEITVCLANVRKVCYKCATDALLQITGEVFLAL